MVIYLLPSQVPPARAEPEQNALFWAEKTEVLQAKDNTHHSYPCSQTEQVKTKAQIILHARRLKDAQTIKRDLQQKPDLILTHPLQ